MKRLTPFSNGSEFERWKENNCDQCCRYENKSTKPNNAKCRHAYYIDLASATDGKIPVNSVGKIGFKRVDLSSDSCALLDRCEMFNKPLKKYPIRKKADERQKELF